MITCWAFDCTSETHKLKLYRVDLTIKLVYNKYNTIYLIIFDHIWSYLIIFDHIWSFFKILNNHLHHLFRFDLKLICYVYNTLRTQLACMSSMMPAIDELDMQLRKCDCESEAVCSKHYHENYKWLHCLQTHRKCLSYSSLLFYSTIYTQPHDACIMHQCSKHNMPDLFGIRAAHPKLLSGLWLTLHATWWFTCCIIVIWISKQLSKLEYIQTYIQ